VVRRGLSSTGGCGERRTFVAHKPFPARGDKAVRAQSICGRIVLEGLRADRGLSRA
jgi:hypothetical protein